MTMMAYRTSIGSMWWLVLGALLASTSALIPSKPWGSIPNQSTMTMYFDDVSRHDWKPTQQVRHTPIVPNEKTDAIRRMLLGYNAESASQLSRDEIMEQMQLWASKSGVVGSYFGDELYTGIVGQDVCQSTYILGALADFWACIAAVIDKHTDEYSPLHRWVNMDDESDQIHFCVFPLCPDLYDYKTMFTFVTSVEFSKELCLHLGKRFSLTLFHPKFKNSPKMLSPERHSPFPTAGLHFEPPSSKPAARPPSGPVKRQRGNSIFKPEDADDDEDVPRFSKVGDLDEQRHVLEVLFNSAAASSSGDAVESMHAYDEEDELVDDEELHLTMSFYKEKHRRRRSMPNSKVQAICEAWIAKRRYTDERRTKKNRALQFADCVGDRWTVSSHKIAEKVYADIWRLIADLYSVGVEADRTMGVLPAAPAPAPESGGDDERRSSHFDFMKSLSRSFQPAWGDSAAKKRAQEEKQRPTVVSSMFVTTKFCAYNAQAFKRFAITINAALKRLTGGRMFIEVYHNEYTGQSGFDNALRRSPFPMIQICYEVRPTTTTDTVVE